MKRILAMIVTFTLLATFASFPTYAASEEYWTLEELLEMGAVPPEYNAATDQYEIGTAEQLLFLTGEWKPGDSNGDGVPDAPRDGYYVLVNDIDMAPLMGKIGHMPPISSNKSENEDKTDGWFLGTFDGQYHAITNLHVHKPGKYVGLFGYAGYKSDKAAIQNLALIDILSTGEKNVATLVGVSYATINNCVVTGKVVSKKGDTAGDTSGGLLGKVKAGDSRVSAEVNNCFVYVDVYGSAVIGGIAGTQDGGGHIRNSFAGGVLESTNEKAHIGGITGSYNAGESLGNCIAVHKEIRCDENAINADKLVGSLPGESGLNINNNYTWEGTVLRGTPPAEHPDKALSEELGLAEILSKSTYADLLHWDFDKTWTWMGEDTNGYPMLKGFVEQGNAPDMLGKITADLVVKEAVITGNNPQINFGGWKEKAPLAASVVAPDGASIEDVRVYYGADADGSAFTDFIEMTQDESGVYTCEFPTDTKGTYYYFYSAKAGGKEITYPYYRAVPIEMVVDERVIDGTPKQITLTQGSHMDELCVNWLSEPEVSDTQVRYKEAGAADWQTATGTGYLHSLTEGWEEVFSHKATLAGLEPDTEYEYQVGSVYEGKEFWSPTHTVKTIPDGEVLLVVAADVQAEEREGNIPFAKGLDYIKAEIGQPDLVMFLGDIVDKGFKNQEWDDYFDVLQPHYATLPMIHIPGNHDQKGDLQYAQFGARFNMPNGFPDIIAGTSLEHTTGWFEIGDACVVAITTIADPTDSVNDMIAAQLDWAGQIFEQSNKRWRILISHAGPYLINHDGADFRPLLNEGCDALKVDLYLNGHDHMYMRGTILNNEKVAPGEGTTYITTGAMGLEFDEYLEANDPYVEVFTDGALQTFKTVSISLDKISIKSYQRTDQGTDKVGEIDWTQWDVVDEFEITQSLMPYAVPTVGTQPEAADTIAPAQQEGSGGGFPWMIVILVIAAAVIVLVVYRRKQANASK